MSTGTPAMERNCLGVAGVEAGPVAAEGLAEGPEDMRVPIPAAGRMTKTRIAHEV
jgi:hypothetical protein